MKKLAIAICCSAIFMSGNSQAETFKETSGVWTVTSVENKGPGPKQRCIMRLEGIPEATGDGFRLFVLSDLYVKDVDGSIVEKVAVSVVLGPGTLGTENLKLENVTVRTAPGRWNAPADARWLSRDISGSLALVLQAPLETVARQLARGDAFWVEVPAGETAGTPLSVGMPLRGSSKALRVFEKCRRTRQ